MRSWHISAYFLLIQIRYSICMPTKKEKQRATYFRNIVFGIEDSLVSTVGLLSGIAIVNTPQGTILLAGVVLIFVEAFSMATGSFLSENNSADYLKQKRTSLKEPIVDGTIMFFSYFLTGIVPIFPYMIWQTRTAFFISIAVTLVALFVLGVVAAKFSNIRIIRNGIKTFIFGGLAVALGVIAGQFFGGF